MKTLLVTVLSMGALAPAPSPSPRLLVSVHRRAAGTVAITVENLAPSPTSVAARAYLTLQRVADVPQAPSYWAEMMTPALPAPPSPIQLDSRQRIEVTVDVGALAWAPSRFEAPLPLARAVPPGKYELQVQVIDDGGNRWASETLPVRVTRSGALRL